MIGLVSDFYNVPTKQFKWNWGAFANLVLFGFANRTYKTILAFLPCLIPCLVAVLWAYKIVPLFVVLASTPLFFAWNVSCGLFAERWVWGTGQFEDGSTFRAVMDSWNRAGGLRVSLMVIGLSLSALFTAAVLFFARELVQGWLPWLFL